MKLRFTIDYHTLWGENLFVSIKYIDCEGAAKSSLLPMSTTDGELWVAETAAIESRKRKFCFFEYAYEVRDDSRQLLRREWDGIKRVVPFDCAHDYVMDDLWHEVPLQQHLTTAAYKVTVSKAVHNGRTDFRVPFYRRTILFKVAAPQLGSRQTVAICGSHPALGGWNSSRYLLLHHAGEDVWQLSVNADGFALPVEYKFVVVNCDTHELVEWEQGDNRVINGEELREGNVLVIDGGMLRVCERPWRKAGVAVPLFALRGQASFGCGDFADLRQLIDWADETGLRVIQLLPVNDTTSAHGWTDAHPYNIISSYALHPHCLSLYAAGKLNNKMLQVAFERRRRELESMKTYDYEAVDKVKSEYVAALYHEQGQQILASSGCQAFVQANRHWLLPYVAFCLLRDQYGTCCFEQWGEYAIYDTQKVTTLLALQGEQASLVIFTQYLLYRQLADAAGYARSKGIILMGDMTVGVCRYSVDTWVHPKWFNTDTSAGTPPSGHDQQGQNWGLPTYNWTEIEQSDYQWWKGRLSWMERFFDAVRVDHVAGFFAMWQIPAQAVTASLGYYVPSLALTGGEIEGMGLTFKPDFLTRPFVNEGVLDRLFGIHAHYVRDHFLRPIGYGLFTLSPELDTQRKIMDAFEGKSDENSYWIRDGLLRLAANVLFLADSQQPSMFYPRIGAWKEPVFEALGDSDRDAYTRICQHYFGQRNQKYWCHKGWQRLDAVFRDTRMLVCVEDLGHMPDGARDVLDRLRMLTLEIQTLPKVDGYEFVPLSSNPVRSVCTSTTHDMAPLRLWWEQNPQQAQHYYTAMLQKEGRAPRQLTLALAEEIVARHLYSPSMLCILPIQDLMACDTALSAGSVPSDERINTPGDSYNRWQYRMVRTLDELQKACSFNKKLKAMVERSRRS